MLLYIWKCVLKLWIAQQMEVCILKPYHFCYTIPKMKSLVMMNNSKDVDTGDEWTALWMNQPYGGLSSI